MFATTRSRSRGSTISRTSASTRATSCEATSMRVPDGDFMLMTNWPASVRGKKATPRSGYNVRLATTTAMMTPTAGAGARSNLRRRPSYRSSAVEKIRLKPDAADAASSDGLRKRAQNSGTTVIATRYDAKSEETTASASAENRKRLTPYRNITGKNTTELV